MNYFEQVPDHDQYMRLLKAANERFPSKRNGYLYNRLWSYMVRCATENPQITDKRELKALVRARVENRMQSSGVFISALLWWVLPKLIEFFVVWWFKDKGE